MKNNLKIPGFTRLEKIAFVILFVAVVYAIGGNIYVIQRNNKFIARVDSLNVRISELHEMGYTLDASRKIGLVEFGFIPSDSEYVGLMED